MDQSNIAVKPGIKHKSFTYFSQLTWLGERAAMLRADGRPELRVSSPPEFNGEDGTWTPEHLFVATVNTCVLLTFSAFAERKGLHVRSYKSNAEGKLQFEEGSYRFTEIIVRPVIELENGTSAELARQVLENAHRKCLITNSIRSDVRIDPTISVAGR